VRLLQQWPDPAPAGLDCEQTTSPTKATERALAIFYGIQSSESILPGMYSLYLQHWYSCTYRVLSLLYYIPGTSLLKQVAWNQRQNVPIFEACGTTPLVTIPLSGPLLPPPSPALVRRCAKCSKYYTRRTAIISPPTRNHPPVVNKAKLEEKMSITTGIR